MLLLAEIQTLCTEYWNRIYQLESQKIDIERQVTLREYEVILENSYA